MLSISQFGRLIGDNNYSEKKKICEYEISCQRGYVWMGENFPIRNNSNIGL